MIGFRPGWFSPSLFLLELLSFFLICSNRIRPVQHFLLGEEAAHDHPRAASMRCPSHWGQCAPAAPWADLPYSFCLSGVSLTA